MELIILDEGLKERIEEDKRMKQEMLDTLGNSIQSKFETRAGRRTGKENQWLRSGLLYYGKLALDGWYSKPETPFNPLINRNRPDVNIVRTKCSIAISQTVSMQFGTGNKNWDLIPAKNVTDPLAVAGCAAMSAEIEDQLEETKYAFECRKAMWDRVVIGTGILKGPTSTGEVVKSYQEIPGTGTWVPSTSVIYKPTICRVNPWFFYPNENAYDAQDIPDAIELHPMDRLSLKKLMNHPGFFRPALEEILEKPPEEYNLSSYTDFASLSENNPNIFKDKYLVLEYNGPIAKHYLDEMGVEPCYDSIDEEYYGEVWVCQGKVIRLELESIEAAFRIPYYVCSWEKDPGSVFGYGVPLMMEDAQRVVNEAWHMILDNSSMSSGPQVAMHKHLIEPANGKWELGPNQIWYLTDTQFDVEKAIQFFNVPNVTPNLIPILQMAQVFSEEESQIPLITAGLQSPQTQDTATGQLVIQHASTTLLDFMSEDWDDNVTGPVIEAYYSWNMQNNPKSEIKGLYAVDVRTSSQFKNKQLHIRDLEKLSVEVAQNPEMAKYIHAGRLAEARLEMMSLPTRTIFKTEEERLADEEAAKNAAPPPEILELQLDARRLDVEEARLEFEMQQQQQREAWEHEEKMTANQARLVESQARVTVSQNEKETEILKLAQRSDEAALKLLTQEKINRENLQTKAFLEALKDTRKQQENELFESEIELKRTQGSGI